MTASAKVLPLNFVVDVLVVEVVDVVDDEVVELVDWDELVLVLWPPGP